MRAPAAAAHSCAQDGLQRRQAARVLGRSPDGDAQPFRQLVDSHRTRNNALPLEFKKDPLAVADMDENKINGGGDEPDSHLVERLGKKLEALGVSQAGSEQMFLIIESGKRPGLGDRIDIEGLPNLFEGGDEFRMADPIPDPEPRQSIDFRERAHQEKIGLLVRPDDRE